MCKIGPEIRDELLVVHFTYLPHMIPNRPQIVKERKKLSPSRPNDTIKNWNLELVQLALTKSVLSVTDKKFSVDALSLDTTYKRGKCIITFTVQGIRSFNATFNFIAAVLR